MRSQLSFKQWELTRKRWKIETSSCNSLRKTTAKALAPRLIPAKPAAQFRRSLNTLSFDARSRSFAAKNKPCHPPEIQWLSDSLSSRIAHKIGTSLHPGRFRKSCLSRTACCGICSRNGLSLPNGVQHPALGESADRRSADHNDFMLLAIGKQQKQGCRPS